MGVNICCCAKIDNQAIKTLSDPKKPEFSPPKCSPHPYFHQAIINSPVEKQEKKTKKPDKFHAHSNPKRNFLNTEQNELEETLKKQFLIQNKGDYFNLHAKKIEKTKLMEKKLKHIRKSQTFSDLNEAKVGLIKIYGQIDNNFFTLLSENSKEFDKTNDLLIEKSLLIQKKKELEDEIALNELPP